MESIDDLLAQLRNEYQTKQTPPKEASLLKTAESSSYQFQPITNSPKEEISAEIKALAEEQRIEENKQQQRLKEEALQKEQQLQTEKLRLQQQQELKRVAITKEAEAWLKNLNFDSEEGLWFAEFSYAYPSKLEAAIDYLQALCETNP